MDSQGRLSKLKTR
uniref:Uncharacterized protein n=1 Tax=Musa acuminata subsp. malaccensis TaxID=214687 RepID=A0A804JM17_MUSAM